ncbi:MAG: hypothetical protein KIT31_32835 [Deltaproteobacteria bacterium]|nr:hypothetical protein [Deltaproteobacteria bacterium]
MPEPSLPPLVRADLDALAADNRRDLVQREHMYRDDRLGTEARRDHLAAQRRGELASLPITLAHVFAHRVARAATGAVALAGAIAILLAVQHPRAMYDAGAVLGRQPFVPSPIMLAILASALLLAAHVVATRIAEVVFARGMARTIAPTGDVHGDLDRLAEGPADVARRLVRRADAWAVGLTALGAFALMVVVGAIAFTAIATRQFPNAWSADRMRSYAVLETNASGLIVIILAAGGAFVGAIGRACGAEHRRGTLPRWVRALEHRAIAPLGLTALAGTAFLALRLVKRAVMTARLPEANERLALVLFGGAALFAVISSIILGIRRREEARCAPPP